MMSILTYLEGVVSVLLFRESDFCSTMYSWLELDIQLRSIKFVLPGILPK